MKHSVSRVPAILLFVFVLLMSTVSIGQTFNIHPEDAKRILPLSQLKSGMKGYGLTVFRGDKIERFHVEVLGVMPHMQGGQPLILVRIGGGELDDRHINIAEGMSGSPIYINNRVIGAIAYAGSFATEPLGLVTPIEAMLEAWDSNLPVAPPGFGEPTPLPQPISVGNSQIQSIGISSDPTVPTGTSDPGCAWFRPMTATLTVSGFSARTMSVLNSDLSDFQVNVRQGPGPTDMGSSDLKEGSAVGFSLVTGDLDITAIGTVTYRRGDDILAFGHPFLQIGAVELPMTTAWVHDVFTSYMSSFKLASPGRIIGSSTQDRPFAVAGVMGKRASMTPLEIRVSDDTPAHPKVFRASVIKHPLFTPILLRIVTMEALDRKRPYPGEGMAVVKMTVTAEEVGVIERSNMFFSQTDIAGAALSDLNSLLTLLRANRFYPVSVEKIELDVKLYQANPTAEIEQVFVDKSIYEPGDTIHARVQVRPYKSDPVFKTVKIDIPETAADGRAVVVIQGGSSSGMSAMLSGLPIMGSQTQPEELRTAANIKQLAQRFTELETNNQVVGRLLMSSQSFNVDGERLTGLPPGMQSVMESPRSSGIRQVRDEAKSLEDTNWYVGGAHMLPITIQRKSLLERATQPTPPSPVRTDSPPTTTDRPPTPTPTRIDQEDDDGVMRWLRAMEVEIEDPVEVTQNSDEPTSDEQSETEDSQDGEQKDTAEAPAAERPRTARTTATQPDSEEPKMAELGRTTQKWLQSQASEFARGRGEGIAIGSDGSIEPGYTFKLLDEWDDLFVWSLTEDAQGNVIAGTGNRGAVLQISPEGDRKVLFETSGSQASAVLYHQGRIWAGSSPDGTLWIYQNDNPEKIIDLPVKHISAITSGPDDTVFVAAGDGGQIWQIDPAGKVLQTINTGQKHVQCLFTAQDGTLYAGTAASAVVYRIKNGRSTAIMRLNEDFVSSVVADAEGTVYASTGPRGKVYRFRQGTTPVARLERLTSPVVPLVLSGEGYIVAADGAKIHRIYPDGRVTETEHTQPIETYSLKQLKTGQLVIGTTNSASLWQVKTTGEGWYESPVRDAERPAAWGSIRFAANGSQDAIRILARAGNTEFPDSNWTSWRPVALWRGIRDERFRYAQYRVEFKADNPQNTTRLIEVEMSYLPANRPPSVRFTHPKPGEAISKEFEVRWTGSDPDRDKLSYELAYSSDGGASWQALEVTTAPPADQPENNGNDTPDTDDETENGERQLPTPEEILEQMREQVDRNPDLPEHIRQRLLDSGPEVAENIRQQIAAQESTSGNANRSSTATSTTSHKWDTTKLKDGVYWLKVTASDILANASDALTDEAILGPLTVVNTKPTVNLFMATLEWGTDDTLRIEGLARSSATTIAAVQYRIGEDGDWASAQPVDGIFDRGEERFIINARNIKKGEHTIQVNVKDSAGNTASTKRTLSPESASGD